MTEIDGHYGPDFVYFVRFIFDLRLLDKAAELHKEYPPGSWAQHRQELAEIGWTAGKPPKWVWRSYLFQRAAREAEVNGDPVFIEYQWEGDHRFWRVRHEDGKYIRASMPKKQLRRIVDALEWDLLPEDEEQVETTIGGNWLQQRTFTAEPAMDDKGYAILWRGKDRTAYIASPGFLAVPGLGILFTAEVGFDKPAQKPDLSMGTSLLCVPSRRMAAYLRKAEQWEARAK